MIAAWRRQSNELVPVSAATYTSAATQQWPAALGCEFKVYATRKTAAAASVAAIGCWQNHDAGAALARITMREVEAKN